MVSQVLVVCANGDFKDNRAYTARIMQSLDEHGFLDRRRHYKYISVNPDAVEGMLVYDEHLQKGFEEVESIRDQLDDVQIIIFQSCMTGAPYTGDSSVFYHPKTFALLHSLLDEDGLFLNSHGRYYDGKGNDAQRELQKHFVLHETVHFRYENCDRSWDVWKARE